MTSLSQAGEKDEIELRPGLTYATHDGVALLGDLYLPKGAGPFPVLVALHGGGWVQGARNAFQHWGPYLARARVRAVRHQLPAGEDRAEDVSPRGARRARGRAVRARRAHASSSSTPSASASWELRRAPTSRRSRRSAREAAVFTRRLSAGRRTRM